MIDTFQEALIYGLEMMAQPFHQDPCQKFQM